ncbi:MAG: ABC transporter permease [Verrucomicrobiota bacterium]
MKALNIILPIVTGAFILGTWWLLTATGGHEWTFFPSPVEVLKAGWSERALLLPATVKTLWMAVLGFISAVLGGGLIALVLAISRPIRLSLYPWVLAFQTVPVVVMIPILLIWFDYNATLTIVTITFMISFFPVVANTTMGLTSTDRGMQELFRTWQASRWQTFLHLRIPFALPYFLTGLRIAAVLAPIGVITGDMLTGTSQGTASLGFLLAKFRSAFRPDAVFAVALISAFLGFFFTTFVYGLSWLLLRRWHDSQLRQE